MDTKLGEGVSLGTDYDPDVFLNLLKQSAKDRGVGLLTDAHSSSYIIKISLEGYYGNLFCRYTVERRKVLVCKGVVKVADEVTA
jgi:hypothetical protein